MGNLQIPLPDQQQEKPKLIIFQVLLFEVKSTYKDIFSFHLWA